MKQINGVQTIKINEKLEIYKADPADSQLMMDDYPPIAAALYLRCNDDKYDAAIHCAGVFAGRFSEQFRSGILGDAIRIEPSLSRGAVLFRDRAYDKCIKQIEKALAREDDPDVQHLGHLVLSIAYSFSNREDRGYQAMRSLIHAAESRIDYAQKKGAQDDRPKGLWAWIRSIWTRQ